MYSKEWLQRAENLQLMTMDEQKLFLKVLKSRFVLKVAFAQRNVSLLFITLLIRI